MPDDPAMSGQRLVGGQHVRRLGNGKPYRRYRLAVQVLAGHRAGGLAHGEQPDIMAEFGEPAGEVVDDKLSPAVGRRRYRHPGRSNQADPHV
jgi:hypothetical protein